MDKIWNLYENLNEIVYAADIHSYELCYVNKKARESFGIESLEEIQHKKCYEVFQNRSTPCEICTNDKLKEGEYYEWIYFNPVVGKKFALKDTLLKDGERESRLELAIDMSVQEEQKKTIQEFEDNEALVNKALRYALSAKTPTQSLQLLLEYIGEKLQCERAYIFESKDCYVFK